MKPTSRIGSLVAACAALGLGCSLATPAHAQDGGEHEVAPTTDAPAAESGTGAAPAEDRPTGFGSRRERRTASARRDGG